MVWIISKPDRSGAIRHAGMYRDPEGRTRSAGVFASERAARSAARGAEERVRRQEWIDPGAGKITFAEYAEHIWLPSRHLEVTTRAGYASYLRNHFVPYFGRLQLGKISPSAIQGWVSHALDQGLSPRSIAKYHTMLHSIFARAVRDRLIAFNPCADTELPKVVTRRARTLTPAEFDAILSEIPERFRPLVLTGIETGLRWGELIALRPRHIDFLRRAITVEETIVEVSRKDSPTGQRMIVKPYPKDDEPRTLTVSQGLLDALAARIATLGLARDDLLFPSREMAHGEPLSRATFNTRYWRPAVQRAGIDFPARMHDLRHAHASWLLAGGADLKAVMERMGHAQIMTTQKYLHTLPDADQRALAAFEAIRTRR
ncbi:tyrosine-type recombinase/integrase [Isoptericola sp. b441]|uniref:Tyrosine-type recombinase/integrase n=1 Tax=Actinotalea lenta TaxID=3064654 RepID=A0ABT9DBQ9_9CELL|nr:tyrosine-type recombinase/integrase [Isoptericola sp. b441]MDO8108320.1 tyrosine-type recombinase/integrase [Isoptericola sp. b441]